MYLYEWPLLIARSIVAIHGLPGYTRAPSRSRRAIQGLNRSMTTTVFDGAKGFLTSDSRWSKDTDYAVLYVDDTGFDKIETAEGLVFLFAGNSMVIQQWKTYLRASLVGARPTQAGIALLIAEIATGNLLHLYQQDILLPDSTNPVTSFAGSGARHAVRCWETNSCAKKAVDTAKTADIYSGGEIKFFELATGQHNLTNSSDLAGMGRAFLERGKVMYTSNDKPISVQEAAANDPRVAELCKEIAKGKIPLNAPCDAMYNQPTADDDRRLDDVLSKFFKH